MKAKLASLSILLSILFFASCNLDKDRKLTDEEQNALRKAHNDSIMVVLDSVYKTKIYIPPLYDKQTFDSATTSKFYELATQTEGSIKFLVNSELITTEIINILQSNGQDNADLLFLIDKTSSMRDDILHIRKGIPQIIEHLKAFNHVRVAVALYGDKNTDGEDWFSYRNFDTDLREAENFINNIEVTGGGDYPESVYEGFFEANKQGFWESETKRMILLIGDAPPLESPLSDYSIEDVISAATKDNITMNFYPIVVTPIVYAKSPKTFTASKVIENIFPNPSFGHLHVDLNELNIYTIEVYDALGKLILSEEINARAWDLDTYPFEDGVYMLRVISADKEFESAKFVIRK